VHTGESCTWAKEPTAKATRATGILAHIPTYPNIQIQIFKKGAHVSAVEEGGEELSVGDGGGELVDMGRHRRPVAVIDLVQGLRKERQ
jgi:hypothetical protein